MKTTFKDVITQTSWVQIEKALFSIYPEEQDLTAYYKRLYWELTNLEAKENPDEKTIEFQFLTEEEVEAFENEQYDELDYDFDDHVEMTTEDWQAFLGYYMPEPLFEEIDLGELIAHTFIEATYGNLNN